VALIVLSRAILFSAGLLAPLAEQFWTGRLLGALVGFGGLMALFACIGRQDRPI
jgi:hypothetical protein